MAVRQAMEQRVTTHGRMEAKAEEDQKIQEQEKLAKEKAAQQKAEEDQASHLYLTREGWGRPHL